MTTKREIAPQDRHLSLWAGACSIPCHDIRDAYRLLRTTLLDSGNMSCTFTARSTGQIGEMI
jgi:hypothetical protein